MLQKITFLFILLFAITVKSQSENYSIKNIEVNNKDSNFGTTFYGDDKVVYASPKKKSYIIRNVWKDNNQPFLDLYVGDIAEDGELIHVKKFSEKLNTRYHEADVAFTKNKKTVYFSRNNYFEKKLTRDSVGSGLIHLYRAKIKPSGEWFDVEPMPFNNDQYQTGHPTLSADETVLYFISDMPGSLGKTDVFKASISKDGTIGEPINLGPQINTPEREMFASISGNDELYFSSDGRSDGLGELDVYVTKIRGDKYTEPLNLGTPINSEKDDFAFILNYETRRGYFSSNRDGGKGDDDIYTFIQEVPIQFECKQQVTGIVTEQNTGLILPGATVTLFDIEGIEVNSVIVGVDATFNFEVDCNNSYKIEASKQTYDTDSEEFYTTEGLDINLPLELDKNEFIVERGNCLVKINPIYFDFDKSYIRPDAVIELDKVVEVMKKYPELIIEGGSHTDSRATFAYNGALSTRRAESTVQYIINKGIDVRRISSVGYGERELVNKCIDGVECSEKEHQFNRRTEFKIVNREEIREKYPFICTVKVTSTEEQIEDGFDIIVDPKNEKERRAAIYNKEFVSEDGKVMIRIKPIYFDLNASLITNKAVQELNEVVKILKKYPQLKIEVGSHTDSRASNKYNEILSANRAKSTVNYIVSKGIDRSSISAKGYGETQLVNNCSNGVKCTETQHQLNRRTEFVIVNPEAIK